MDQKLLNTIALDVIAKCRNEVFLELQELLERDCKKRREQIPSAAIHHVHNAILFDCLVWLNPLFIMENDSENAWKEYLYFADTLRTKFQEIVNALKDFQPISDDSLDEKKNAK
jgi:hypothetical protein